MALNRSFYHKGVEVDEDQASAHDQVGYQRQRSQVFQVGSKDQEDEERKEAEHVETGVETWHQDVCLVSAVHVTVERGSVGCFDHLVEVEEWEKKQSQKTWKGK